MSNIKKPASSTAKPKKLLLFPGDPLIKTLKPDYYTIVDPGTFNIIFDSGKDVPEGASPDDSEEIPGETNLGLKAPTLSDITLVSKKIITDKNKNQYVEFTFNIKNSGGETVVGVNAYGQ